MPRDYLQWGLPFLTASHEGRHDWWRYVLSFLAILFLSIILTVCMFFAIVGLIVVADSGVTSPFEGSHLGAVLEDTFNAALEDRLFGFVIMMLSVAMLLPATALSVRLFHKRRLRTLLTGGMTINWHGATVSFLVALVLYSAVFFPISWLTGNAHFRDGFNWDLFWLPLFWLVVLVPPQALAEEVVFRGYLLQLLTRLTRSPLIIIGVSSLIFCLLHIFGSEGNFLSGQMIAFYGLIAVYMTLLAVRGNGIEYSTGFHVANNYFALGLLGAHPSDEGINAPENLLTTPFFSSPIDPSRWIDVALFALLLAAHYWIVFYFFKSKSL